MLEESMMEVRFGLTTLTNYLSIHLSIFPFFAISLSSLSLFTYIYLWVCCSSSLYLFCITSIYLGLFIYLLPLIATHFTHQNYLLMTFTSIYLSIYQFVRLPASTFCFISIYLSISVFLYLRWVLAKNKIIATAIQILLPRAMSPSDFLSFPTLLIQIRCKD